jgi:hypothetical protein
MTNIERIFAGVNGATFISIDTSTVVPLNGGQSNPMLGRVRKIQIGSNVMVFQNKNINGYEAMVRRRLENEGKSPDSFTLSPRAWGVRRKGSPFVDHNGKLYLEVIFLKAGKVEYALDGYPIDKDNIVGLKATPNPPKQEGLNNKVIIRTFDVENIRRVVIDHTIHIL